MILEDPELKKSVQDLGEFFRAELKKINCDKIVEVRGKGLLNAVVFEDGFEAWDVCIALKDAGLLAKQTHGNIIRFAPPLVITKDEIVKALEIIKTVFEKF